jgi:hypothetical protein
MAFRYSILEDHQGKEFCAGGRRASPTPHWEDSFPAPHGPSKATVHLHCAGAIADTAQRDRRRESHGSHERAVVVLDPDGDLRALGWRESDLEETVLSRTNPGGCQPNCDNPGAKPSATHDLNTLAGGPLALKETIVAKKTRFFSDS